MENIRKKEEWKVETTQKMENLSRFLKEAATKIEEWLKNRK